MSDEHNKYKYLANISKHCYIGHDQHTLCNGSIGGITQTSNKKCTCRCHKEIGDQQK